VEFGLNFSAKAGVYIAESAAEAHLNVTAEWSRPAESRDGGKTGPPTVPEGEGAGGA
jgi:hypothetical protein